MKTLMFSHETPNAVLPFAEIQNTMLPANHIITNTLAKRKGFRVVPGMVCVQPPCVFEALCDGSLFV
jgi:hypothetical protein